MTSLREGLTCPIDFCRDGEIEERLGEFTENSGAPGNLQKYGDFLAKITLRANFHQDPACIKKTDFSASLIMKALPCSLFEVQKTKTHFQKQDIC